MQQYLYLNDKPVAVIDNSTGDSEIIALHTDRRGAPVAASDKQGKVIWTASYSAWGQARIRNVATTQAANDATFNLDLRLPGQWEDRATHLHYNYQRDYNPSTGKYLTPDPLGFPDGPDAYLYVGGDPVNKVDPLGLYSTEVHYYLTYFLARVAGLSELQARTVASAAQFIDDNDFTRPLKVGRGHERRLALYHFTYSDAEIAQEAIDFPLANRFLNSDNAQLRILLGYANRNILCTKAQLFGEYLHAFQDSFAHRKPDNAPFTVGDGIGHGLYGEDPDSTFDVIRSKFSPRPSFTFNNEKAIAMEQAVFESFRTNFGLSANDKDGFPINFSTIRTTLLEFNAIPLRGDRRAKWGVLDTGLRELGLGGIPPYSETWARNARRRNLVDSQGNPLNPIDYPNAILQTE